MKQNFLPILSAFVVIFSVIFLFTPFRPQLTFVTPELKLITTPTPVISTLPTAPVIVTSTWKTYKDKKYGFEFKYPNNMSEEVDEFSQFDTLVFLFSKQALAKKMSQEILFSVNFSNNLSDCVPLKDVEVQNTVVAGKVVKASHFPPLEDTTNKSDNYTYYVPNGNNCFMILHRVYQNKDPAINFEDYSDDFLSSQTLVAKILSTFKFTNSPTSTAVPTSNFCGGFANIQCPAGYECSGVADYPDAGGTCVKK